MDPVVVGGLTIPEAELSEEFSTSGGPGGQHANRNETAVRLRFDIAHSSLPDDIRDKLVSRLGALVEVTASEERSQLRNRETARQRLATKVEAALENPKPRKPTKPSRASKDRRIAEKKARSQVKKGRGRPTLDD